MANTPSSRKAVRKIAARTEVNKSRRTRIRTFVRKFDDAVAGGNKAAAEVAFKAVEPELMRAVTKGVLHKNAASRKVSRLAKKLKAISA
ncbi:30S ribosomal protein S20 [Bartonella apis]|uniref:30S ribosomal protein S20 n=1 Tax=Bartonella apis TaxID=1686310 RepID=UPI00095A08F3|nr:30S ribosomal protein S20 [Bartonella apis]OLY46396.1 small subunit ribosomal protein S20 [Bartonella apis]